MGNLLESASAAAVNLLERTLSRVSVPRRGRGRPRQKPARLIYDKAADSAALRKRLRARGIDVICPHRRNRQRASLQDGRKLRRYKRRWKIERTFSWLGTFRRLVVRWERPSELSRFFPIACLLITLNKLIHGFSFICL